MSPLQHPISSSLPLSILYVEQLERLARMRAYQKSNCPSDFDAYGFVRGIDAFRYDNRRYDNSQNFICRENEDHDLEPSSLMLGSFSLEKDTKSRDCLSRSSTKIPKVFHIPSNINENNVKTPNTFPVHSLLLPLL